MDHLAWTLSVAPTLTDKVTETPLAVIFGKLISGIAAVVFAYLMCKLRGMGAEKSAESKELSADAE